MRDLESLEGKLLKELKQADCLESDIDLQVNEERKKSGEELSIIYSK